MRLNPTKYAYFSIPKVASQVLPDDPKAIWDLAMKYREYKSKLDTNIFGQPKRYSLSNLVDDVGAGIGLGTTMLGAKLNQSELLKPVGTVIKKHGVNVLTSPNLQKVYGIGIPTLGLGATSLAVSSYLNRPNQYSYDIQS